MQKTLWQRTKDNTAIILATLAMGGIGAGILTAQNCGGSRGPAPIVESIRGDGRCSENERWPYMRNPDGSWRMENGQRIPNPSYSKEDCFRGDNVCDNVTNPSDLRTTLGEPMPQPLLETYVVRQPDGGTRPGARITLPLEDGNSRDCMMQQVREHPCGPRTDGGTELTRPMLSTIDPNTPLVQRTYDQFQNLCVEPAPVCFGNNYFDVPNRYRETCTESLPACDANVEQECYCANHQQCRPAHCGNGVIERQAPFNEECDPRASPTGCRRGKVCSPTTCRCVTREGPCGNGRVDPGERCDQSATPNGCGPNQTCSATCRQCNDGPTHTECRNEHCVSVQGAGTDQCSSDADCRSPPVPDPPCTGDVRARLEAKAGSDLRAAADHVRSRAGAQSTQTVSFSIPTRVMHGVAHPQSISVSCPGCTGGSADVSRVSLGSVMVGDVNCVTTLSGNVAGERL